MFALDKHRMHSSANRLQCCIDKDSHSEELVLNSGYRQEEEEQGRLGIRKHKLPMIFDVVATYNRYCILTEEKMRPDRVSHSAH